MYKLVLKVDVKSMAKVLGLNLKSYLVGHNFKVIYNLKNEGDQTFPGGYMRIQILWPNGQIEQTSYSIPKITPTETKQAIDSRTNEPFSIWGVLSRGFALFFLGGATLVNNQALILYGSPDIEHGIRGDSSFFSILGKEPEELYQLWALIFAIASLLILVSDKVLNIFKWIASIFN